MTPKKKKSDVANDPLEPLIFTIRGQRVILDVDLARLYGVTTKVLNQAVKRNAKRFPADFAFQLTVAEEADLRSQITTFTKQTTPIEKGEPSTPQSASTSSQLVEDTALPRNWSQFVTSSSRHRGAAYRPWAFTEHGSLMAANILRSERAIEMSVFVVRAFVRLREQIAANQAVLKRLVEIDTTLLQHDTALRDLYRKLLPLLQPPPPEPPKRRIGFYPENKP